MSLNKGYAFVAFFLGLTVLFVSISRAGIEIIAQEGNEGKMRNELIEMTVMHSNGTTETVSYKVPEVNTLPSNPFYGFKKLRDYLWFVFSRGDINKAKISILLADKKISEVNGLVKENNSRLALEAGSEALDKLKYADKLTNSIPETETQLNEIKTSIYRAGFAYREVLEKVGNLFEVDMVKYNQIIDELDQFNEQKREEKEQREE